MISIIIPAYQSAHFIERTIRSVLQQTYSDFELIVVDDGSTDHTRQIMEELQRMDARIRYCRKENGGVSSARNRGIEEARGTYISFLDSDDLWEPVFLEKMTDALGSGNYDVCFSGYIEQRGEYKTFYPKRFDVPDVLESRICDDNFRIHTDSWLINRSFLLDNQLRFTEGCHLGEDIEFFTKVLYRGRGKTTFVPLYLTTYCFRPDSLCGYTNRATDTSKMESVIAVYKRLFDWMTVQKSDRYAKSMSVRITKTYLYYLWELLLLETKDRFDRLKAACEKDRETYGLQNLPTEKKYRIWEYCIFHSFPEEVCRGLLRPYKHALRKAKTRKIAGNPCNG